MAHKWLNIRIFLIISLLCWIALQLSEEETFCATVYYRRVFLDILQGWPAHLEALRHFSPLQELRDYKGCKTLKIIGQNQKQTSSNGRKFDLGPVQLGGGSSGWICISMATLLNIAIACNCLSNETSMGWRLSGKVQEFIVSKRKSLGKVWIQMRASALVWRSWRSTYFRYEQSQL